MSDLNAIEEFRGHDFFFVGDSGKLYRISSEELMKHELTREQDEVAYDYFKDLADNQGAVLTLRQPDDTLVVICFMLNCRAIRTEWRP